MDKEARVLRLIQKIDSGKISSKEVARTLDQFYQKPGETEIIYEVNDRTDKAYYEELLADAKIGIYNRQSLIRMVELKYKGKSGVDMKKASIIGGAIVLTIMAIIVVIAAGGES